MMRSFSPIAFLDTNVLVYNHQGESQFHDVSQKLIAACFQGDFILCISPQVLLEFFAVITSARRVTNPVKPEKAILKVEEYLETSYIQKVYQNESTLRATIELVKKYRPAQQHIFDLHLVATMLSNGITRIYTFNEKDFSKYAEIEVLNPESVIK
ncbi:MAG: type II toxin-antitoxin system VapC family toxin [Ignavibacteriaceae bacterium]